MKARLPVPALVMFVVSAFGMFSAAHAQSASNDCNPIDGNDSTESVLNQRLACYNSELDGLTLLMGKLLKEREQLSVLLDEDSGAALADSNSDNNLLEEQLQTIEQLRLERSDLSAQLHKELIDKHEQLLSKEAEDRLLRNYSEAYLAIADENAELVKRVKTLNEQLTELTTDHETLTGNNESMSAEIKTYKATVADLSAHRTRLSQDLEKASSLSEKMKKQLLVNADLTQQQIKDISSLRSNRQSAESEVSRLNNELENLKTSHASELSDAADREQALTTQLDALSEEHAALVSTSQQAATDAQDAINKSQQEIEALNNEIVGLKDERLAVSTQLDNADKLLAENKDIIASMMAEGTKQQTDIQTLNDSLASKDSELEQTMQQLQSVTDNNTELTAQIESLQQQNTEAQTGIKDLQGENAAANEAIAQLNSEKAELVTNLDSLQSQHDQLAESLKAAEAAIDTASSDRSAAAEQIDTLTQSNTKLQDELSATNNALAAADDELVSTQQKLSQLTSVNADTEGRAQALEEKVASLQALLDESQNNNETVAQSLASIKSELDASNQRLADQQSELNQLLKEKESIVSALNKAKSDTEALAGTIRDDLKTPDVQVEVLADNTIGMKIASSQLFRTGSSVLSNEGKQLLGEVAATLKQSSTRRILIEGHSDNVPLGPKLSGIFTDNMGLSMARATSAATFFTREGGLPSQQLSISGAGDTRPLDSNDTEEGRRKNRRVEIMLLPLDAGGS